MGLGSVIVRNSRQYNIQSSEEKQRALSEEAGSSIRSTILGVKSLPTRRFWIRTYLKNIDATTKDMTIRPTSTVSVEALSFQILSQPGQPASAIP